MSTLKKTKPDYKGFAAWVLNNWPECYDIEGYDIHDAAVKYGLLVPVEGGFDPEVHECPYGISEKGDPWYNQVDHKLSKEGEVVFDKGEYMHYEYDGGKWVEAPW